MASRARLSASREIQAENAITFRFIFSPLTFTRTLTRITPVQNFTNDLSWVKGNHNFGFGTNIRLVRNRRDSFDNAFDNAVTNPSFYQGGGATIADPVNEFSPISGATTGVENAVTALIGRFSQYSALFTFDRDGTLLPSGTPAAREFRTEEYDVLFPGRLEDHTQSYPYLWSALRDQHSGLREEWV